VRVYQNIIYQLLLWRMLCSGMLHHVALVRTHILEECSTSIIMVTRFSELEMLALTSNRTHTAKKYHVPISPILVTMMMEALLLKSRFLQEPHGVTSQKTSFFIVTTVKTSNLTTTAVFPLMHSLELGLQFCLFWCTDWVKNYYFRIHSPYFDNWTAADWFLQQSEMF
jgi:hypothetical protein